MTRIGGVVTLAAFLCLAQAAAAQPANRTQGLSDPERVALIARTRPSVIHVKASGKAPGEAKSADSFRSLQQMLGKRPEQGSGFVVDSAAGLVVTASHIVDDAERVEVLGADGVAHSASIERVDQSHGFAILRVVGLSAPALALANRAPQAGESALIVGWMLPDRALLAIDAMTMGTMGFDPQNVGESASPGPYFALSAPLPGGSFGGAPVVDSDGQVIGLVAAIYGRDFASGAITLMLPIAPIAPFLSSPASVGKANGGAL